MRSQFLWEEPGFGLFPARYRKPLLSHIPETIRRVVFATHNVGYMGLG